MGALRVGRLRFGFHGLLGVSCLATVLHARCTGRGVASAVLATTLLALTSTGQLKHAPVSTTIMPGVVAPHREAFARTIALMLYYNVRISWLMGWLDNEVAYALLLVGAVAWLAPKPSALRNGNTLIFGVPIWVGVCGDAGFQFAALVSGDAGFSFATTVTVPFLLMTHLVTLIVAFAFTLAFRGYLSTTAVYAASAGLVAFILVSSAYEEMALGVLAGSLVSLALYRVSTTEPSDSRRAGEAPVPPPR
ncbi:hypothetical protein M885DRAFT_506995 [Pelagophyceae sp. CCMP2097]|nr:hypothetical protein M885DRAFT_506995 [Pelagophyceae sp. CCMP2097]|mmetsp:Transcript_10291/g.36389  ORF Transcript_10291/g.36389 Transcript_10291/m.36389 type:complete len:249 (+) Transcript_10291:144-890(+)